MNKIIKLSENDLHRIISDVINEAYGTPTKQDKNMQQAMDAGKIDDTVDSAGNAWHMQHLSQCIYDAASYAQGLVDRCDNDYYGFKSNKSVETLKRYGNLMVKKAKELENIYHQVRKIISMMNGEQPDRWYNKKHVSYDEDLKNLYQDFYPNKKLKISDVPDYMRDNPSGKEEHTKYNANVGRGRTFTTV